MNRDETIYDLGDVETEKPRAVFGGTPNRPRPAPPRHEARQDAGGVGPALAASLSMFVPGLGQMISGEMSWGFFYLSGMGLCAASLWAALATVDRLVPTLGLLGLPPEVLVVSVCSLALLTIALHLTAVLHAHTHAATAGGDRAASHPIVAGLASLLIPGWGQLLAGHRRRAALFLGGVWVLSAAWLLVTPAGTRVLARLGFTLPGAMRDGWGPVVMLAAPLVLWVIAVYDAAAGAAAERRA